MPLGCVSVCALKVEFTIRPSCFRLACWSCYAEFRMAFVWEPSKQNVTHTTGDRRGSKQHNHDVLTAGQGKMHRGEWVGRAINSLARSVLQPKQANILALSSWSDWLPENVCVNKLLRLLVAKCDRPVLLVEEVHYGDYRWNNRWLAENMFALTLWASRSCTFLYVQNTWKLMQMLMQSFSSFVGHLYSEFYGRNVFLQYCFVTCSLKASSFSWYQYIGCSKKKKKSKTHTLKLISLIELLVCIGF